MLKQRLIRKGWGMPWRRYVPTAIVLGLAVVTSWAFLFHPTSAYLPAYGTHQGWWLLALGLPLTLLLGVYLWNTAYRAARIEQLAHELSTRQTEAAFLDDANKLFNSSLDLP